MKRIVLIASMLFLAVIVFSQTENKVKKVRYGFSLSTNYSNLQSAVDLPANAKIQNNVGFGLGIFMDYSFFKNLVFSPKAEISFNDAKVEFTHSDNSKSTYSLMKSSLDFKAHLVYKLTNTKLSPYILVGPGLQLPLENGPTISTSFPNNKNFTIDFGIGLENNFKYFIFTPELRYSYGLSNVNFHPALQELNYHNITLAFNFK